MHEQCLANSVFGGANKYQNQKVLLSHRGLNAQNEFYCVCFYLNPLCAEIRPTAFRSRFCLVLSGPPGTRLLSAYVLIMTKRLHPKNASCIAKTRRMSTSSGRLRSVECGVVATLPSLAPADTGAGGTYGAYGPTRPPSKFLTRTGSGGISFPAAAHPMSRSAVYTAPISIGPAPPSPPHPSKIPASCRIENLASAAMSACEQSRAWSSAPTSDMRMVPARPGTSAAATVASVGSHPSPRRLVLRLKRRLPFASGARDTPSSVVQGTDMTSQANTSVRSIPSRPAPAMSSKRTSSAAPGLAGIWRSTRRARPSGLRIKPRLGSVSHIQSASVRFWDTSCPRLTVRAILARC
mmetsp:Transcript_8577/g.17590  ORF Transcript_8577/g.17590 Transcript_8577/m.17590 type:complete len:351 (-) Transcript_8577:190-1242(-)